MAVEKVRHFRAHASPRLLIAIYATLSALVIALTALAPGLPSFSPSTPARASIFVAVLVVLFLLLGSLLAWWIALIFSFVGVMLNGYSMLFGHGALGFESKALGVMLLEAAAVVVLTSPALECALRRRKGQPELRGV
jgi:small-conductance mechanosensitive channel